MSDKEQEQQLHELEFRYRSLVEQIPAITYTDSSADGSVDVFISPQFEQIFGYDTTDFPTLDAWVEIVHPDDRAAWVEESDRSEATEEPFHMEYRAIAKDGRELWVRDEARLVRDETTGVEYWQGVILDITKEKQAAQELEAAQTQIRFLAYHDTLTGLANRALFEEMLEAALARARRSSQPIALIFIDLDRFKAVNDTYGHAAGDELLKAVGSRLTEAVRESDLVARQGGDEFLVLLTDLEPKDADTDRNDIEVAREAAETVCARIASLMEAPVDVGPTQVQPKFSLGIALYPTDGTDSDGLLRIADAKMYEHKAARQAERPV